MTVILAVGLAWLLAATVVASIMGMVIRRADTQPAGTVLDRLLVEGYRDLEAIHASRRVDRHHPRAA